MNAHGSGQTRLTNNPAVDGDPTETTRAARRAAHVERYRLRGGEPV